MYIYIQIFISIHTSRSLKDKNKLLAWFSKQSNHLYPVSFQAAISLFWVFYIQVYLDKIYSPSRPGPPKHQNVTFHSISRFKELDAASLASVNPRPGPRSDFQGIQWWLIARYKGLILCGKRGVGSGSRKINPWYYSASDKFLVWGPVVWDSKGALQ